jgi:hypothetical protein
LIYKCTMKKSVLEYLFSLILEGNKSSDEKYRFFDSSV